MDIYKEFIQLLRRKTLEDVFLYMIDSTAPKLKWYIQLIIDVPFIDGAYHTYYGEIKKIINSFMVYLTLKTDEIIKEADRLSNILNRQDLIDLIGKTITIQQIEQIDFGKAYLPVTTPTEKQNYEDIELKYNKFIEKLLQFAEESEKLNTKSKIEEFCKSYFQIPIRRMSEIFEFAHVYVSMMLADRVDQIRTSIEEISLRLRNNLREVKGNKEKSINTLLNQLYDKNKEQLAINRRFRRSSTENNEVLRGMEIIRGKIKNNEATYQIQRLEEEVAYWEKRLKDFYKVADTLNKLKTEQENEAKQEEEYKMMMVEVSGPKTKCWENIGQNYSERKEYLSGKITEAAKALRTHFACKGIDRIYYIDNVGPYYVDEFNHQVYVTDYAMATYHKDCEGRLRPVSDKDKYYFDVVGRYIMDNGQKTYQCASCTSQYRLCDDLLLSKMSKDCGHSEIKKDLCELDIKDQNIFEMIPSTENVDIKKTLDSEVVQYLWDSFGAILPEVLHDIGLARPLNPTHYLAHKLMFRKYGKTSKELHQISVEAEQYRTNVYKERHEKAAAASLAWKSKQVKRRKPEESDVQNIAIYEAQRAQRDFIDTFNWNNNL